MTSPGNPEAPGELIAVTEDKLGPVDILVSNAGLGRRQSLEEISSGDFDDMLAVNLRAPFLAGHGITVNALAPALITGTAMLPGDPGELRARVTP